MNTEVILKTKIEGLGGEADIVKVRPGYARNFLLPRGLAIPATKASKHQIERLRQIRAEREANELNTANEYARKINKMTLTFQVQAGDSFDKIFGSVTSQDIMERLAKEGLNVDRKRIKLYHPLKELKEHEVEINLHPEVKATLRVVLALSKADQERLEALKAQQEAEAKEREEKRKNRGKRPARSKASSTEKSAEAAQ